MNEPEISFGEKGYLSLKKFVEFLEIHYPLYAMSYGTALKLARNNMLGFRVGGVWRVSEAEAKRWVTLDEQAKEKRDKFLNPNSSYTLPKDLKHFSEL